MTTTGKERGTCQLKGVWQITQKQIERINTSHGDAVHGNPSQQVVSIAELITRQEDEKHTLQCKTALKEKIHENG